jgi:hypothetical protein
MRQQSRHLLSAYQQQIVLYSVPATSSLKLLLTLHSSAFSRLHRLEDGGSVYIRSIDSTARIHMV